MKIIASLAALAALSACTDMTPEDRRVVQEAVLAALLAHPQTAEAVESARARACPVWTAGGAAVAVAFDNPETGQTVTMTGEVLCSGWEPEA